MKLNIEEFYQRSYVIILTHLSNTINKLAEKLEIATLSAKKSIEIKFLTYKIFTKMLKIT